MSAVVLVKQGKSIVTTTSDETLYVLKAEESPAIANSTYVVAEDLQKACGALHTWLWIPRRHPTARGDVYLLQHVESCLFAYADHCRYGTMYLVQDEDEASMFNLIRRGNTVEAQALPPVDTSASIRSTLAMGVFQDSAGRCSAALHCRKASTFTITAVWHEFPAETATAPSVISAFAADSESEALTSRSSTSTSAPASSPDFESSTETDAAEVSDVNDASDQDASADMANALPWHPLERLKKQHLQDAMETGVPVKFVRGSKDLLDGPHRCPIFSCKFTATSWTALEGHLSSHHMVEGLQPLSRRSLANPTAGATTEQLFFDRARDRLTYAATQWPATCPIAHCGKKSADWGCLRQHLRRHGFRSVCLNQHGSRPQCTPPTKRDESSCSSTSTSAPASSPDFESSTETDAAEVSDVNDASDQDASADMANALPWHPLERLKKQHLQDAMETGVPVKFVRGSKDLLDGPHRCPIFSCKFTATSWTALEGHLSSHHMVEGLQPLSRRSLANPTAGATTEQLFFDRARDRLTYAATQWPATCPIAHCGKKSADWGCLRQHLRRHGFRSVCLNQHGSRPQCTPPTKRDEPYVLSNHPNLLVRGQRAPPLTRSATEKMSDAAELQFAADMRLKERELELGADVQAIRLNAFCGGFVVPNTYQRKSLSKRNNRCFSSEDLAPWTVIAVERDAIFRSLRHNHCQQAEHANCLLTWVTVGIPEDRVTVQIIVAGPKGIPAATECRLLDPTISPPPPRLQSTRRLAVDVTFPETEDAVDTEWPWGEPYYYGVGPRHKLPREQHSSSPTHSQSTGTRIGPTVYYPDCALRVQNCAALGGDQKEVVAEAPIQQATCFAYCGPRCDPDLDDDTTMVQSDSTAYRGGNIIRYVNHYFGFSDAGNVVFRTAKLLTRSSVSSGSTREVELTFLITTRNIAPRELLLAQSYGPAYDIHLQRIALTKGLYLSAVEARRLLEIGLLPQYSPHHLNSLAVGDVVGLRETNGKVTLHIIDEVVSQSGALVLQALTELKFPQYAVPDDDAPTVTVLASHVIPFVNQWDFSLDRDHRKLTMKTPTLQMKLDRLSKC
jgi:hypothetical protein